MYKTPQEKKNMRNMPSGIGNIDTQDLQDASRVIHSDKFAQFLMSNTTSFIAAAWMLQTLMDAEKNASAALNED